MAKAKATSARPRVVLGLVVIDQEPLRRSAGAECSAVMVELEARRAAWHRFEREDKPSFARWRAREFGPLLSETRDVETEIRARETLVHEVEMEMRRGIIDPHSAYRRVMARRGDPSAAEPVAEPKRNDAGIGRPLSDFEKETLFQEWVKRSLGTNPDKMDDDAYTATFEAFKSHMFRVKPDEPSPNAARSAAPKSQPVEREEEEEKEKPIDARVKELYRLLVRRLHPDLRADGNASVTALWHEVQEAYGASDVPQLEILLALSDIESERFSEQTSLSQMRTLLADLQRALFALEDSLRQARGEDAWDFARAGVVEGLRARVERELKANLRARTARLAVLRETIALWSRPMATNAFLRPPRTARR